MFPNGAEVMPDGEGGAIVQALQECMCMDRNDMYLSMTQLSGVFR